MLTYRQVKGPCARVLNKTQSDSTVVGYVNRAQENLMDEGKFVGTFGRFRICANNGCITWPREIETIETWSLCNNPGSVRGFWYEFIPGGPGVQSSSGSSCGTELIDRGLAVSYDEPDGGSDKVLSLYAHENETSGAYVLVQYYDDSGQWVRSQPSSGTYIDGERITIPAKGSYQDSTFNIAKGGLVRIYKPKTNGFLRLYEKDTDTGILKELGVYHPSETVPVYRRSLIPGLTALASNNGDCEYKTVEVGAKLKHIPIDGNDDDFLLIDRVHALALECQSIKKYEDNLPEEGLAYHELAKKALDNQLRSHLGDGIQQPIVLVSSEEYGAGVHNLI